ncbi:unnamed protein product [Phytophthora fragariaefolia]|uniref:Unnamed protein product n=1 Tax=Phytophthora fragariaefolia TaxID=1490495 RepID=A0A9W6XW17_9STRA|nr:unnamed protein product [Phytophthora fragariaefolia]
MEDALIKSLAGGRADRDRRTSWGVAADSVPQQHVDAKPCVALRLEKRTTETLQLVSDDVELYSQRDGSYRGKEQLRAYLDKAKVEGSWQPPAVEHGAVVVRGVVQILLVPISVKSVFTFTADGRICGIHASKAWQLPVPAS